MPEEHGTLRVYGRGCRCDECRRANREYAAIKREEHRPAITEFFTNYIDEGDTSWLEYAACKDADTEIFFPQRGDGKSVEQAKQICATCSVSDDCLQYALRTNQEIGIWGGRSGRQLREMHSMIVRERRNKEEAA